MKRGALLLPVAALLLDSCLPPRLTLPQSPALKWLERKAGRIAFVDAKGNVRTMDQAGGSIRELTRDASIPDDPTAESSYYQYPAWSPDGRSIAFIGVRRMGSSPEGFKVWTVSSDGAAVDSGGPVVMVAYADESIAPRKIADGLMATWSPK